MMSQRGFSGAGTASVCYGLSVGDMETSGQIETMRVSAETGCATCSLLYRRIRKIEIARHRDHVRQSSLSPSQDLCNSRTMSFSQSNSLPYRRVVNRHTEHLELQCQCLGIFLTTYCMWSWDRWRIMRHGSVRLLTGWSSTQIKSVRFYPQTDHWPIY
jgi:hypothetical protein